MPSIASSSSAALELRYFAPNEAPPLHTGYPRDLLELPTSLIRAARFARASDDELLD